MADDLGWGDVSFHGNSSIRTPHLEAMREHSLRFSRFYAAAPVCSPTRASCLTGRHPYRVNIPWAGDGFLPPQEITIAEALKTRNYVTGHFGKWHVGGLSKTVKQSYFLGPITPYSPPWENGFDVCFSTESMMPTYNPYYQVGGDFGTPEYRYIQDTAVEKGQKTGGFRWRDHYWEGPGKIVDQWLEGDDSKIIMSRNLTFIKTQIEKSHHFFSVVWFHTPHTPIVAGNEERKKYAHIDDIKAQHWYGSISAMDHQIGRLRDSLRRWKIEDNTIIWFCSDNGPSYIHNYNSAGPFKGKKSELYEGGIRVPALLEWPARFTQSRDILTPCVTSDIYPTLLEICNLDVDDQPRLDGESILPILEGTRDNRNNYIGFQSPLPNHLKKSEFLNEEQYAVQGKRFKLISTDNGSSFQLYDLIQDPSEKNDVYEKNKQEAELMKSYLEKWRISCHESSNGKDY